MPLECGYNGFKREGDVVLFVHAGDIVDSTLSYQKWFVVSAMNMTAEAMLRFFVN